MSNTQFEEPQWCNHCTVQKQSDGVHDDCRCEPNTFSVDTSLGAHLGHTAEERHAHYDALLSFLDTLTAQGGHDAQKIERIRRLIEQRQKEEFKGDTLHKQEQELHDEEQAFKSMRRDELKRVVLSILNEDERIKQSPQQLLNQELDYESGSFKIIVRSSERSPFNPRRVIASSRSSGSGFLINAEQRLIVTNGHVIRNADAVFVMNALAPKAQMRAVVLKVCFDLDLALIRVVDDRGQWNSELIRPLKLCTRQRMFIKRIKDISGKDCGFARLQRVFAVGYPLGSSSVQITNGIISGFEGVSDEVVIQMTAPISHGNSGGALLNSDGEVIGITNAGIPAGENIGFAIPVQTLINALSVFADRRFAPLRVLKLPFFGIEFTSGTSIDGSELPSLIKQERSDNASADNRVYVFDESVTDDEKAEEDNAQEDDGGQEEEDEAAIGEEQSDVEEEEEEEEAKEKPSGVYITKLDPIHAFTQPVGGDMIDVQPFDLITELAGFVLNDQGVTKEQTYPRSMPLKFIFRSLPFSKRYAVKFWRQGRTFINEYDFLPVQPQQDYGVRTIEKEELLSDPRLIAENSVFVLFDQLRLARLNLNFVEKIKRVAPWLTYYAEEEQRERPRLVVLGDERNALRITDVVDTIDGQRVGTREEVFALLRKKDERNEQYSVVRADSGRYTVVQKRQRPQGQGIDLLRLLMSRSAATQHALEKQPWATAHTHEHEMPFDALSAMLRELNAATK